MLKYFLAPVIGCLALCVCAVWAANGEQTDKSPLKIAFVLDSSPTKVTFSVTNAGKEPISTSDLGTNANRPVFIMPDGKELEDVVFERLPRGVGLVTIGPGETKTWELEISKRLHARKLTTSGMYGLYWLLGERKSNTLWFVKVGQAETDK